MGQVLQRNSGFVFSDGATGNDSAHAHNVNTCAHLQTICLPAICHLIVCVIFVLVLPNLLCVNGLNS